MVADGIFLTEYGMLVIEVYITHCFMDLSCYFQAYIRSFEENEGKNARDGSQSHCFSCDASMTILCLTFVIFILVAGGVIYTGHAIIVCVFSPSSGLHDSC